jgi:hypothetical protein
MVYLWEVQKNGGMVYRVKAGKLSTALYRTYLDSKATEGTLRFRRLGKVKKPAAVIA